MTSSLPGSSGFEFAKYGKLNIVTPDGPPLSSLPTKERATGLKRIRRASETARSLAGSDSKRANPADLKCKKCGKGYKHSSCLAKHLWEHTPEWAITSKLLISKHQQVQLLEAASVLVNMNDTGACAIESDRSESSPAASGPEDTTPPPDAQAPHATRPAYATIQRHNSTSSGTSSSYQSDFSDESPGRTYMSHYRQWSTDGRSTTSGMSALAGYHDDDERADLAAAVGLLSCSQGTPKTGPMMLPADVPPVPPLPAKYSNEAYGGRGYGLVYTLPGGLYDARDDYAHRPTLTYDERVDEYNRQPRSIEEEEGVFGKMEE